MGKITEVDSVGTLHDRELTTPLLQEQARTFWGTGGTSDQAKTVGFLPGFIDKETGRTYRACFANGMPAPMHVLDGLPSEVVTARDANGRAIAVKCTVVAGFLRMGQFFTRAQAAQLVMKSSQI